MKKRLKSNGKNICMCCMYCIYCMYVHMYVCMYVCMYEVDGRKG